MGEAVRGAATEQLADAISALEQQPQGLHEAIHEARKKFKRVRALYRLVACDLKEFRTTENTRLRDVARTLSVVRDATALVETVAYLQDRAVNDEERSALAHARDVLAERRDALARAETDLPGKVAAAIATCHEAIAAIETANFPKRPRKTARLLATGWAKGLARGRAALEDCHHSVHEEVFHELRKASQSYWMNLSLLRGIWPSAMNAKRAQAKMLVETLGHEHDLALLAGFLDRETGLIGGGEEFSHLLGAIIREQQELRRSALALAEHVLGDTPEREGMIIEALWIAAAAE
ncbi:CHAD domain-containing protein [Ciceribacter naphthalenivorans]|uniref:CHAD domain-containing protein n=2 Tax=Alphaproteobacteria TaxID=28211 RepID=A0A512HIZ5_9HYPH|nr:CHAD domain-containing protein [Ciceribacter naphthalenivorans]GLR21549.1 CHAD domain-containing protein [Ciceribacter naphthalenivorans]GLT04405.1 CHAD domain-containing protein [Sphingomonas psychrolutea]